MFCSRSTLLSGMDAAHWDNCRQPRLTRLTRLIEVERFFESFSTKSIFPANAIEFQVGDGAVVQMQTVPARRIDETVAALDQSL